MSPPVVERERLACTWCPTQSEMRALHGMQIVPLDRRDVVCVLQGEKDVPF
jgi:hypothetical protein